MMLSLKIFSVKDSSGKEVLPLAQDLLCLDKASQQIECPEIEKMETVTAPSSSRQD